MKKKMRKMKKKEKQLKKKMQGNDHDQKSPAEKPKMFGFMKKKQKNE